MKIVGIAILAVGLIAAHVQGKVTQLHFSRIPAHVTLIAGNYFYGRFCSYYC